MVRIIVLVLLMMGVEKAPAAVDEGRRNLSNTGVELIKKFEGLRLDAYYCAAGVLTIGYGHIQTVRPNQTITSQQAEELLHTDAQRYVEGVNRLVKVPLTQNQFDALVSFSFNLGLHNLSQSTLLKKLNNKDYQGAAQEFVRWNKANGKVLRGLTTRRLAESKLFTTP